MISKLHRFVHTGIPAFSDMESVTTIEMLEKLYGKNSEIIEAYNQFETNVNNLVEDYRKGHQNDFTVFVTEMRQEFQDFIDIINLKVMQLNSTDQTFKDNIEGLGQAVEAIGEKVNWLADEMENSSGGSGDDVGVADWNTMINKPFGEEGETKVISWDLNTDGLYNVYVEDSTSWYHVSDYVPTMDEINGTVEYVNVNDTSGYNSSYDDYGNAIELRQCRVLIVFNDNSYVEDGMDIISHTFEKKGVYFGYYYDVVDEVYYGTKSITFGDVEVKQLDEKYIPESIARVDDIPEVTQPDWCELEHRPFGMVSGYVETYIDAQDYTLADGETKIKLSDSEFIIPTEIYELTINGKSHVLICKTEDDLPDGKPYIGILHNGNAFSLYNDINNGGTYFVPEDKSITDYTITLKKITATKLSPKFIDAFIENEYGEGEYTYKVLELNEEFIPANIARTVDDVRVKTTYDPDSSSYSCEITYGDITINSINCSYDDCRISDDDASMLANYIKTTIPRIIFELDGGNYFCVCEYSVAHDNTTQISGAAASFFIYPESAEA